MFLLEEILRIHGTTSFSSSTFIVSLRLSSTRASRTTQKKSHAAGSLSGLDGSGDKSGATSSKHGAGRGASGSGSIAAAAKKAGADKGAATGQEEKRGSKIVVRMAQPLQQQPVVGTTTSQNEAIRLAVEAERKQREEAKEKMALVSASSVCSLESS
jgi:hypothetical protein